MGAGFELALAPCDLSLCKEGALSVLGLQVDLVSLRERGGNAGCRRFVRPYARLAETDPETSETIKSGPQKCGEYRYRQSQAVGRRWRVAGRNAFGP